MGFDISYHPIKESEIQQWYFETIKNNLLIDRLASEYAIEDFYKEKYRNTISAAGSIQSTELFDKTHGFYIAVIQGFFRPYFYTRGSTFSFLIEEKPEFSNYTKRWEEILHMKIERPIANKITENYSSGVFIPADQIEKLLVDYATNEKIKSDLDYFYSHGRISVFLKALAFSKENKTGLLEATEVVEPNPFDLNKSVSYSNLFNCDKDGVLLYEEAALEQIKEAEKKEKKGFWKKLFE